MCPKNLLLLGRVCLLLLWALSVRPDVVINEIHYDPDVKTESAQFIELYNTGPGPVDLTGWRFSSGVKFTFPTGAVLAPDGYYVVAQNTNSFRSKFHIPAQGQYTGKLSKHGEKLVLQDAARKTVDEVEYVRGFPWPITGVPPGSSIELIHPALDNSLGGSWRGAGPIGANGRATRKIPPTPGARNSVFATNAPPQLRQVSHEPEQPKSGDRVRISARVSDPDGVGNVALLYQVVEPGNYIELKDGRYESQWVTLPMTDDGQNGDARAGDSVYTAELPASVQKHRTLVRYRIKASDRRGETVVVPYRDDPQPNFAYFVYDGVPAWKGAIQPGSGARKLGEPVEFGTNVMRSLPVYHLISRKASVDQSQFTEQYRGKEYKWWGTLVYDGQVYDHIRFRARGGGWRYAMGKNMWKFEFNRGHDFAARDDYGIRYGEGWNKLNLGACIQQADYGQRGEQGMFEAVGFRLFNLAGVEAPETHWVQFRVIDAAEESKGQYEGDFWGLYLAVEQMNGRFLKGHGLSDGNLYKMEGGGGELNNQGEEGVTDGSDLQAFMNAYRGNPRDDWWRRNFDLPRYYDYRSIVEAIHDYDNDEGPGKNYFYYHNPDTGRWSIHPWDIDLTWSDHMYGGGESPFKRRVLPHPAFNLEYQNRCREIRDLLFNTDQAHQLIDEYAALISDPTGKPSMVGADRAVWDYNPIMGGGRRSMMGKTAPGLFYQASPTRDFAGMVRNMKQYVVNRSAWMDRFICPDDSIPAKPEITATTPLGFRMSPFKGTGKLAAVKWRVAGFTDPKSPAFDPRKPRQYEINAQWTSEERTDGVLDVKVPVDRLEKGGKYRVRARMKDDSGRWSHWSDPLELDVPP